MHREYHPSDMHHLRAHAFEEGAGHAHREAHRTLYTLTALLGLLIGGGLAAGWVGLDRAGAWLIWAAALLGAARIVY